MAVDTARKHSRSKGISPRGPICTRRGYARGKDERGARANSANASVLKTKVPAGKSARREISAQRSRRYITGQVLGSTAVVTLKGPESDSGIHDPRPT